MTQAALATPFASSGEQPAASDPGEDHTLCEWMTRIAATDERALELLYDATVSRVFTLARGITRNEQCAEAVTEEVYWQVWRQALRFDRQRGPVLPWLLTFARSSGPTHDAHDDTGRFA